MLSRRARRDATALELEWPPVEAAIEALLTDLERLGLLDDGSFAASRARSLAAKGRPPRRIAQLLAAEGIARPLIDQALEGLAEEHAAAPDALELETAIAYARRRRLGPFAPPDGSGKPPEKALAAFARAGFSSRIARLVLAAAIGRRAARRRGLGPRRRRPACARLPQAAGAGGTAADCRLCVGHVRGAPETPAGGHPGG